MKKILDAAYQPIVEMRTGRIAHFEALARLRGDPQSHGHGALISVAERYGFIHEFDFTMFDVVLSCMENMTVNVAINVSPATIHSCSDNLINLLLSHASLIPRVIVEITESMPIVDVNKVQAFMSIVRSMGARIALDDYGNGKGCFTEELVCQLRPDFLKLDGAVLERALFFNDRRELSLACEMAASFGGDLIAEYVDSARKVDLLESVGVRLGQGARFGMPKLFGEWPQYMSHCAARAGKAVTHV